MELLNQILGLLHWNRIRGKPTLVPQNGFPNRTDSTLETNASGVFSITPASTVFKFYSNGKVFTKAAAETVNISNDQTLHYVYYSTAGVLTVGTTKWSISSDNVPVATVFKDGTDYATCSEQHSSKRDRLWHEWAHDTIGARYESGLGGTFANTTFSIAQGVIHDEDLEFDTGGSKTACRQWYRNSGLTSMRMLTNKTTPWVSNAGAPQYDNAGTMANVSANRYFCSYFFTTNDASYPIYMVAGQAQHVNLSAARAESYPSILLTTTEWKLIYKVIYQESSGSAVWVETVDFRNVSSGPASTYTPTDHNSLTSRDAAGSHPATAIANTPAGDVAATTVQAAIDELDTEKEPALGNPATTGFVLSSTDAGVRSWVAQSGGDFLATLVNTEVTLNGAATATIGKMHLITDATPAADYSIALPAVSGNAGKFVGFRVSNAATKFFTVDPDGTEKIWCKAGEVSTRVYSKCETVILQCDGTQWHVIYETMREVGFKAYDDAAQSCNSGANTIVNCTHEEWDIGGCYDGTNKFTPNAPGIYRLTANVAIDSLGADKQIFIFFQKNGSGYWYSLAQVIAIATTPMVSSSLEVVANGTTDYFQFGVFHDHGSARNTYVGYAQWYPQFSGTRIRRETS